MAVRILSKFTSPRVNLFGVINHADTSNIPLRVNLTSSVRRHKATVIDGKAIGSEFLKNLKASVEEFTEQCKRKPFLSVILVGEDTSSELYVKNKVKAAKVAGIETNTIHLPFDVTETELKNKISQLNGDSNVDGVLLQLPLPDHLDRNICQNISPEKDVDGFTAVNFGKFALGFDTFVPCTALAVQHILNTMRVNITGRNIVVCGRSKHVGLPIAMILHSSQQEISSGGTTTICHRHTPPEQLVALCREADILISATGVPSLIRGHMVKKGAIVIDVGISRAISPTSSKPKITGDVNFEEVVEIADYITPVPGGVGPVTVAMLMQNTFLAARRRADLKES